MNRIVTLYIVSLSFCTLNTFGAFAQSIVPSGPAPTVTWEEYGGPIGVSAKQGTKHSSASQITPENSKDLELYWKLDLKEAMNEKFDPKTVPTVEGKPVSEGGKPLTERKGLQLTPIYVNNRLYGCSNFNRVFSIDVATKKIEWTFVPPTFEFSRVWGHKCRGVSYWENKSKPSTSACQKTIFTNTIDGKLYAIDANTGKLCESFGNRGVVELKKDVSSDPKNLADWALLTAPHIFNKGGESIVVVGGTIWDNNRENATSGVVRAYSTTTGRNVWSWNPIPATVPNRSGEKFHPGTPNAWAPMSSDSDLGLIYIPMGNASPDLFSGQKGPRDHFASSVVALNARTGRVRWQFKEVKNDVWDYDSPAQPALFDWSINGRKVPSIAIGTKMGYVFILDRRNGKEIPGSSAFGIQEFVVPSHLAVPGENASKTQIRPPKDYAAHGYPTTADTLVDPFVVFLEKKSLEKVTTSPLPLTCLEQARNLDFEGIFTPPSLRGSISLPGPIGGIDWGGVSIDPTRNLILFNQNHLATVTTLIPRAEYVEAKANSKMATGPKSDFYDMEGTPYGAKREAFLSKVLPGVPCTRGPWGSLNAIDLNTGKFKWRRSLGTTIALFKAGLGAKKLEVEKSVQNGTVTQIAARQIISAIDKQIADLELAFSPSSLKQFAAGIKNKSFANSLGFEKGIADYDGEIGFGLLNMGGLLTTETGVTAIGASQDQMFRLYKTETGELLKEFQLDNIGSATPMTFVHEGVQYLAIGAGGNVLLGGKVGDDLMIYRLGSKPQ